MKVGLIGTGAIANMHARAYRNIGFELAACYNKTEARGRDFAGKWNAEFVGSVRGAVPVTRVSIMSTSVVFPILISNR